MLLLEHRSADLKDCRPNRELSDGVQHPNYNDKGKALVEIYRQIAKSRTDKAEGDEVSGIPSIGEHTAHQLQEAVDQKEDGHDRTGLRLGHNAFFYDERHRRGEALLRHGNKGVGGKYGDKYKYARLSVV